MLNLLGLLLKAIISLAIGIIGFTWEPKEEIKAPSEKEKRDAHMFPVSLSSTADIPYLLLSTPKEKTNCANTPRPALTPYPALKRIDNITDHGVSI